MTSVQFVPLTSEDRVTAMRTLSEQGCNSEEIAQALGVSTGTVYALARANNIAMARKMKVGDISGEIAEMSAEGLSAAQIALRLKVSDSTVRTRAKAIGISFARNNRSNDGEVGMYQSRRDRLPLVKELFEQGMRAADIARQLGYTREMIRLDLNHLGLNATATNKASAPEDSVLSQERKDRLPLVRELFDEGYQQAEIARRLGYSSEMIRLDLKLMGLNATDRRKEKHAALAESIRELAGQGKTTTEISAALNETEQNIRLISKNNDISVPRLKAVEHGTFRSYRRGCNCEKCRAANTRYSQKHKDNRKQKEVPEELHGTHTGYLNWACRCVRCTEAGAAKNKLALTSGASTFRKHQQWTQEEDRVVLNYDMTAREIAAKLNRTVGAVNSRRVTLRERFK